MCMAAIADMRREPLEHGEEFEADAFVQRRQKYCVFGESV